MKTLNIDEFITRSVGHPILDVRSPAEFTQAHIPGAISFPLFNDEQRKIVGTTYKQISREMAIKVGLDFFGPAMRGFVERAEAIATEAKTKTLFVHCWRGGMRSGAMAWLLNLYGFEVVLLKGGYKAYRNWVLGQLANPQNFLVLGGYTGSGKTRILKQLAQNGEAVIDLESLANHKGSAFGHLGMDEQPSVEMFENQLATKLFQEQQNGARWIWLEAESQRIGNVNMPNSFFEQMKNSPVLFLDIPFEQRLKTILAEYGKFEKEALVQAVMRIRKRLGGLETKTCISFLLEDNVEEAFAILLRYYDKWYDKSTFQNRSHIFPLTVQHSDVQQMTNLLMKWKENQATTFPDQPQNA